MNGIGKTFGAISLNAKSQGVLSIFPSRYPYFEPKYVRIKALDPYDPDREMELRIGAVTVGGSPQLAINNLAPDDRVSTAIRADDIDGSFVNWSVFSTVGLARELQMNLYNPNRDRILIFACLEGYEVGSLNCYADTIPHDVSEEEREKIHRSWEKKAEEKLQAYKEYFNGKTKTPLSGWQHVASDSIRVKAGEQRVLQVIPTVSPYFEPKRIKYHGRRVDTDAKVPFCVLDAFCDNQLMFGAVSIDDLLSHRGHDLFHARREDPRDLLEKLKKMVDVLAEHGPDGLRAVQDKWYGKAERVNAQDPRGMLTSLLVGSDGWDNISHWPVFSTTGLRRELGILVHNPWSFDIEVSATVEGKAVSSWELPDPKTYPGTEGLPPYVVEDSDG